MFLYDSDNPDFMVYNFVQLLSLYLLVFFFMSTSIFLIFFTFMTIVLIILSNDDFLFYLQTDKTVIDKVSEDLLFFSKVYNRSLVVIILTCIHYILNIFYIHDNRFDDCLFNTTDRQYCHR